MREAEELESEEEDDGGVIVGLELRYRPKCKVKIEKNSGCDSMQCYMLRMWRQF